jgi:hypothetical protein
MVTRLQKADVSGNPQPRQQRHGITGSIAKHIHLEERGTATSCYSDSQIGSNLGKSGAWC